MLSSSLMEKNSQDELSDAQAEEVADIVDALTFELQAELKVLGADLDALGKDVDELEAKVDAMDVPEDNIEFGMDVTTTFEVANYEDETEDELIASMMLWADGDALDLDMPTDVSEDAINLGNPFSAQTANTFAPDADPAVGSWEDADDLPSEKRFWQEYDFTVAGNLGEAEFNLAVDTFTNAFAEENSAFGYNETDSNDFVMDSALLEVAYNNYGFKMGDLDGYHLEKYLVDDEDMEGLEATYTYNDINFEAIVLGEDDDTDNDFYGLVADKDMTFGNLAGKVYQVRMGGGESSYVAVELTDFAATDVVTLGGEVAFNDWDGGNNSESDIYAMVNGEFAATEALTVTGMFETVGPDFFAYNDDLAGEDATSTTGNQLNNVDYNKFEIGAEFVVNEMNTVNGSVAMVQPGDDNYDNTAEDKLVVNAGWDNEYGDFTNSVAVEYTDADAFVKDHEVTVIELGTEYAWNERTTLGAALVNKNEENAAGNVISYNYLKGTMDKELSDNMTWNTEAKYITGDVGVNDVEGEGNALTTSLSVSF